MSPEELLAWKFAQISPHLDERQTRLWLGVEALAGGPGGTTAVALATGMPQARVSVGRREIEDGVEPIEGRRRAGGGRKKVEELDPELVPALEDLVDAGTRGDPMGPLRWTTDSTADLSGRLAEAGHEASAPTVARLLKENGYRLQANSKVLEGASHPDRDAQFRFISKTAADFLRRGQPAISVDTKKKELVGQYKNGGRTWRRKGEPIKVNSHDFPDRDNPHAKAVPYGVYDIGADTGWVTVGQDGDTAQFAVNTLRSWWANEGRQRYPEATELLVTADSGGSNSARVWLWKVELASFAAEAGLRITVVHYPPGTSKWNRIEHRLFSQISINWRGHPLTSHEVVVDLIGSTTTKTGLSVRAEHDTRDYPRGIKVTKQQINDLPLHRNEWHGEWNYSLAPEQNTETPTS
jgi:hypothetical protein